MCVSIDRATFRGTIVYVGRVDHPYHGVIHVLGYQNTVADLAGGPNAMLLHLPAGEIMTPDNFISVRHHGDVLQRMVDALDPPAANAPEDDDVIWMDSGPEVSIFEHDVYTVLLAASPQRIPEVLDRVPRRRRPALRSELFTFYAEHFPDHTIALCCFDNAEAEQAKPLMLWYKPADPDLFVAPALDSHTGGAPRPGDPVPVDHWILFGSDEAPPGWGRRVDYPAGMSPRGLRSYLPDTVIGRYYGEGRMLPNGDFAIDHSDLFLDDPEDRIRRIQPGADCPPLPSPR
ncbi:hypothetical protein NLM24_02600 [Nocardia zapadnayensis]|uniref:hypothetical protein n=1 Tax=Nocardia rhamnosiphila TaxID=426716 RepID=UPI002246C69F|nr:hypothetical protein [Nocardia zapadnayensis]MCX0269620.1 hypothetical protein [Nocardia zapadnayensis]